MHLQQLTCSAFNPQHEMYLFAAQPSGRVSISADSCCRTSWLVSSHAVWHDPSPFTRSRIVILFSSSHDLHSKLQPSLSNVTQRLGIFIISGARECAIVKQLLLFMHRLSLKIGSTFRVGHERESTTRFSVFFCVCFIVNISAGSAREYNSLDD
jgi:hypothetical protein